jgi:hypothetical protein
VLKQRPRDLPAPIQMSDALSRNSPKVSGIEPLRHVYRHDAQAREQALSAEPRLRFHQEHSAPLMKGLHEWMKAQLVEHKTEPNSRLGREISYLLNHWTKLTLFQLRMTASAVLLGLSPYGQAATKPIVIQNVTVIDVVTGQRRPGMTVLISDGKIAQIDSRIATPHSAIRVKGAGKFLIPGLWDMHTHHQASGISSLDLFIAKGVVGTRDMGGDLDFILPLRDRINRGELLGPEIVAAGPILDDAPQYPFRLRVTNGDEARKAVRELKARGVDFFTVHDHTPAMPSLPLRKSRLDSVCHLPATFLLA